MTAPDAAEVAAAKVERLLDQLRSGPDPRAAAVADELVRCLVQLYGAGLERIVEVIGPEQGAKLCADPLVESLLLVHDLHPVDVDTRIRLALERARPRTGEFEYLGIDDAGTVRLRLAAAGRGCGSSAQSVRLLVEAIVLRAAPEVAGVQVEIPAPPMPLLQVSRRPEMQPASTPPVLAETGS
jgi:Fe-S cluster biogenesis protein NfuA